MQELDVNNTELSANDHGFVPGLGIKTTNIASVTIKVTENSAIIGREIGL